MSLPRFFLDSQVLSREDAEVFELRLSADDAHHFKVLRIGAGEHVAVVDAENDYFECEVVDAGGELALARIAARGGAVETPFRVTLFQGIPKADKMEEIVRHATEVGVDAFVPVAFERCVSKLDDRKAAKKRERWQAVAKSAAMQAGRMRVPEVAEHLTVAEACEALSGYDRVIVFWEEAEDCELLSAILESHPANVAVVVGPEGGISEAEVDRMMQACPNARMASLGQNILRTETAGVVGCALAIYELGALGNGAEG